MCSKHCAAVRANKSSNQINMAVFVVTFLILCVCASSSAIHYEPNWESLDSRPLPSWFDEGKIGIFLHWGVFSVPSFRGAWFWYYWRTGQADCVKFMKDNYRPDFTYADFAHMFHAEFYDPDQWAKLFEDAGANYVVLTTKHHDGFTNWPSKYSFNWNSMDVGPKRDLVGDLATAVRKTSLKFGIYHSLFEFYHPLYLQDRDNGFHTQKFVSAKTMPELYELVNNYQPDLIWSDGDWLAADTYWNSTNFLAWLYNESPVKDTVIVNDRWGNNTRCKHGGYWDCADHYRPHKLVPHKWEDSMTVDKHGWAFRRNTKLSDVHSIHQILTELVMTISLGGNIILNVGPTAYGEISPIYQERLLEVGSWLKVNGEAIYKTHVWSHQNDSLTPDVWYTARKYYNSETVVYAIFLSWPENWQLDLAFPVVSDNTTISLVGFDYDFLKFQPIASGGIRVMLPHIPVSRMPCKWAWVLRMSGLVNQKTHLKANSFTKRVEAIRMEKGLF